MTAINADLLYTEATLLRSYLMSYLMRVIVAPAVYPRLAEFLHFGIHEQTIQSRKSLPPANRRAETDAEQPQLANTSAKKDDQRDKKT